MVQERRAGTGRGDNERYTREERQTRQLIPTPPVCHRPVRMSVQHHVFIATGDLSHTYITRRHGGLHHTGRPRAT